MKSSSNLPSLEQKNSNVTNQSQAPDTIDNLSEYDKKMIEKFQSEIKDGTLTIKRNPDLKSLDFIRSLNLNKLALEYCGNIIPKLESLTIKKLELTECGIQNVKGFKLENLEVLKQYYFDNYLELNMLAQEIVQFKKLKELTLHNCVTDFSTLSQIIGLTKLNLWSCEIRSTEALRKLVNIEELYLNGNKDIDITALQYLTDLTKLQLESCNLVNLDALRPLKKLEELNIFDNQIVYLQPLVELKQLSQLDASSNKIIDIESIRLHPNFDSFDLSFQNQPIEEELEVANIMKDINNQISSLNQMNKKSSRIKEINTVFRQKITQQLQQSNNSHVQFVAQAVIIFQKTNVFDCCQ
ncbi:leucine-rich_repeat domain-containing protein [Hexamita inflata]|uniref:Leucine-rich_repeat domain-containing protein n=1 Tax=Hexamita inflata TaxID=28002 RepID=A0ABP1GFT4_9EUKA